MCDPEKLTLITEDAFGFNSDFWSIYADVINAIAWDGESWTQRSSEITPIIGAALDEFRF